jgi:FkbM family methyltransferase
MPNGPSFYEKVRHFAKRKWFGLFHDPAAESYRIRRYGVRLRLPRRFLNHYVYHDYEPVTRRVFLHALRPGMRVADVGAHIGFYTLLAAQRVGPEGKVVAVEPSEENLGYLRENLGLNGLQNVEVHPVAAGARREERTFRLTGSSDSHGFYSHPLAETVEEISSVPLDEIVTDPVQLMKIDVEGAELEALAGMTRILSETPRLTLCIEWNPACMRSAGYDPLDLPAELEKLGFRIRALDDLEGRERTLDDVTRRVRSGSTPDYWYANLWAER